MTTTGSRSAACAYAGWPAPSLQPEARRRRLSTTGAQSAVLADAHGFWRLRRVPVCPMTQ